MEIKSTNISEVLLIKPDVFKDERGFFMEIWQRRKFAEAGIDYDFVQDNHSRSKKGTLRGLHYQIRQPQGKLVRVTIGKIFDVSVDIRPNSPTFGHWVGEYLSAENKHILWIPPGFAHGFYVLSAMADFHYKCTDYFAPEHERCIRWNDPSIKIQWPITQKEIPLISEKDQNGAFLEEAELLSF